MLCRASRAGVRLDALCAANRRAVRSWDSLQGSCVAEDWGHNATGAALLQRLRWSLEARGRICRPWLLCEVNVGLSVELATKMSEIIEGV
ncbi:hypothetical protein L7F22_057660 [Adiantum nelumboides]|nr:hypothetical protein [Adiantum nelumboides]